MLKEIAPVSFAKSLHTYPVLASRPYQIQDPKSSTPMVSILSDGKCTETCPKIVFKDDKLSILLVNAIIILLNSCTIEQLHKIPVTLSRGLLLHLKKVWEEVHQLELCGISGNCTQDGVSYINSIRTNNLAESVFRLSMDINPCRAPSVGFFNAEDTSLENFMSNIWESSPFLLTNSKLKNVISSFIDFSKLRESVPSFLSSMLRGLIHCPPIPSDEHDILHFLDEVSNSLGCPIVHQEDIRVVKTHDSESELHYFQTQTDNINYEFPIIFSSADILKCEQAYKEGYTIALRGMGFRYTSIASVADEVASMFGQPSIGVNLYLTPPGCQGLACHSDDHCVFICQLIGAKKWNIFSPAGNRLPRLYEALEKKERGIMDAHKEVLLKEGDILYIPRGHPHEAHTIGYGGGFDTSPGFSLHLTLSIEVEPPFEWEGFAHVALDHWCRRQSITRYILANSESLVLHKISAILIHIAVKLFGDTDPIFRKACLVGALSRACEHTDWLVVNQKEIFSHIICKIRSEATFVDVLKQVEVGIEKHEDLFSHFKWIRHLLKGEHETDTNSIHLVDANDVIHQISQNRDVAEAVFYRVKSNFCNEVAFEDVQPDYVTLLDDYRKARKQYANGMLSLHCNDN
ncbi:unnamed protein product [Cuscuta europaea]|uniref:Bifunctional lysine-specific demethylase and histidyl-hydroxylase n=1 Tax=Cuscuta europaea TaxID=41803 RepID=A0A9P0Z896_CUSEU|nr:unnamed protein product [Cuscuta europaea]